MPAKRYAVFDADSHVVEPPAIWERHLDPQYRVAARSCFWHEESELGAHTILNGRPAPPLSHPNLPRYGLWRPGMTPQDVGKLDPRHPHAINPGASDPQARLRDMDAMGIDRALLLPTAFLEYFPLVENPDVAQALARAYNDWALDFASASPERLFPVAVLPVQDVVFALREARRVARRGFKAALVRPVFVNRRFPVDGYYLPLWRELESLGLATVLHPSAGPATPEYDANAPFIERVTRNLDLGHPVAEFVAPAMDNAVFLVALMADGLLEKFPKLRLVFAHSGVAWLHLTLEKVESYLWLSNQQEPVCLEPEKLFFARQNLITFPAGDGSVRRMPQLFEGVGCFGSRYPNHDAADAWSAIADLERGGVPGAVIERLMGGNAARVLGITKQ